MAISVTTNIPMPIKLTKFTPYYNQPCNNVNTNSANRTYSNFANQINNSHYNFKNSNIKFRQS